MANTNGAKSSGEGFQIFLSRDWFEVVIESPSSRGASGGTEDYINTFERVISRLGSMNGVLLGAMLNTRQTSAESLSSRLLTHPRLKYPVPLATAVPSELRMALTKIAMSLHSAARTEEGGNSRRRISLFVRVPSIPGTELGATRLKQRLTKPAPKSRLGF
jgi:hypothetical protein